MNVRELIERLSRFDPAAKVVVEYDSHSMDVKAIQPEKVLTDGASWADYPSAKVLENDPLDPSTADERAAYSESPQEEVIAIWGTPP